MLGVDAYIHISDFVASVYTHVVDPSIRICGECVSKCGTLCVTGYLNTPVWCPEQPS